MEYESQLRSMLLRYPPIASELKIYIDPIISGCDKGWISGLGHEKFIEVDNPDDADFIPIWIDYKQRCSDAIWNIVEQHPDKCLHSVNLIEAISAEMPDIDDESFKGIQEMLSSTDWESICLGLNMLRTFYLTDEAKNCIRMIIDTFQPNPMTNTGTIIPFTKSKEEAIVVNNLELIRFFNIWLHNEYLTI